MRAACDAARDFGDIQGLTDEEIARLCIVVEEWVSNLFEHGGLTGKAEIELTFSSETDGIRIIISDSSRPFDPREFPRTVLQPERGGGAGIHIIRAWAELVAYDSTAEGNRLELMLPIRWND